MIESKIPKSFTDLSEWWVVLNSPVGIPWHIETLSFYLQYPPYNHWQIKGLFPTAGEASLFCDLYESANNRNRNNL